MLDAGNRVRNVLETPFELQSIGIQRRSSIVGERTPYRQPISTNRFGFFIGAFLTCSFDGMHASDLFFQLFLGMAICHCNRFGGFSQIMELTQRMGDIRQRTRHRIEDRVLSIGDHSSDWDIQFPADPGCFLQQRDQILLCLSYKAAGYQHLS